MPDQKCEEKGNLADSFPIVCLGASAGGLKALEAFFDHLPAEGGMAYVVVQHLDPHRESHLPSLLGRHTSLPIRTIEDGMKAEPDTVFLNPPNASLTIRQKRFYLESQPKDFAGRLSIDIFLRSLAQDHGENAIAVILSGAASDGTEGVRAINAAGGMTMAQEESQADYPSMPRSAAKTGLIDFVLPVEEMGEALTRYCGYSSALRREMRSQSQERRLGGELDRILKTVHSVTGHDFTQYKKNTVRRRVERRLALHRLGLDDYGRFIREHPEEARALFRDLLINVTGFFRDPEAFEALGEEVARMLSERESGQALRAWVSACATGEEAYTLAILFIEVMDRLEKTFPVKIFATDINPQSIEIARDGLYPENIAAALSEGRRNRFFIRHGEQYRVSGQLRDMIVFSVHDLTRDPPFSRLDVVSCRNLLIYMDSALQRKILPLLHYSLNPGGLLFLGSSEEVGEFTEEHFVPLNRKFKLFRARALPAIWRHETFFIPALQNRRGRIDDAHRPLPQEPPSERRKARLEAPFRHLIEARMMKDYAPPGVLVDKDNYIVYFQGEVGRFVHPAPGEPTFEVLKMVPGPLAETLAELLHRVRRERRRVSHKGLNLPLQGGTLTVDLVVQPMPEAGSEAALITFEAQESEGVESEGPAADARLATLERELYATRQDLQSTIEELETANEELQSANEELQANNEELQSTNEEMETSREELQSTNEELETVNTELKQKNDELIQANDDINNLFGATDIATVILDTDLRIKRFTPAATACFRLIPSDLGRRLTDIGTMLMYDAMEEDLKEVLRTLKDRLCETQSRDGKWYIVHFLPYRTGKNVIAGVILTFNDVTALKEAQIEAQQAREYAENVLNTMREPFLVLDGELRVVSANPAFYQTFQVAPQVTEGVPVFQLGNNQWDIPELRRLLNEIIPENRIFNDFEVNHTFPSIGRRTMLLNARRIDHGDEEGKPRLILLAFQDITAATHKEGGE